MAALQELGGEAWFRLGDADLVTHVERTRRLAAGESLSAIMDDLRRRLGVRARLVPMSDQPVRTVVQTPQGALPFQRYFVERRCTPEVTGFAFQGAGAARPPRALHEALEDPGLEALVICPSNPFISIDPILAVPGMRTAIAACRAPVVAVSPVIGGRAVKGPTAKMMAELGTPVTSRAIAARYAGLLDGFVLDQADAGEAESIEVPCLTTRTLMVSEDDKRRLAPYPPDWRTMSTFELERWCMKATRVPPAPPRGGRRIATPAPRAAGVGALGRAAFLFAPAALE